MNDSNEAQYTDRRVGRTTASLNLCVRLAREGRGVVFLTSSESFSETLCRIAADLAGQNVEVFSRNKLSFVSGGSIEFRSVTQDLNPSRNNRDSPDGRGPARIPDHYAYETMRSRALELQRENACLERRNKEATKTIEILRRTIEVWEPPPRKKASKKKDSK